MVISPWDDPLSSPVHGFRVRQVNIVGFPQPMLLRALQIIARILDINVQRIEHVHLRMPDIPHMCGWILVRRWLVASGVSDRLPPQDDGFRRLSIYHKNLIEEVLAASIEEWITHEAPVDLRGVALRLRRHFFVSMASAPPHVPVTDTPLRVRFVGPTDAATVHTRLFRGFNHEIPGFPIVDRLQALLRNEGWLASDELNFLLDPLRLLFNQILFAPPGRWHDDRADLIFFQDRQVDFRFHEHSIWFVIFEEAWIKLDLIAQGERYTLFVHCHNQFIEILPRFVVYIANALGVHASVIHAIHVPQTSPHGLCGWSLVYDLYWRAGILLPDASVACRNALLNTRHHDLIARIQQESHDEWRRLADPALSNFCIAARTAFLGRVLQGFFDSHRGAAGGSSEAASKPSNAESSAAQSGPIDPLVANDPWKQPKKLFGSRWEDLLLPSDHPLHDSDGKQLEQTHKLQASARRHGVVLATKGALPDLSRITPVGAFAVLIPSVDRSKLGDFAARLKGPHEIVLSDPVLKTEYKRLVLLFPVKGDVTVKFPEAKVTFTAVEVVELVLECDSRLMSPSELETAKRNPLQYIKEAIISQFPDWKESFHFYAFRQGRHPAAGREDVQYQCIMKTPKAHRGKLLQASGAHLVLIRDFIENGNQSSDLSVIPRFWEVSPQALHEAIIVTKNVSGYAGIVLTRRGLAVRSWTANIAYMRKAVIPSDPRLTSDNIGVVPRHSYRATGWPPAVDPGNVVTSITKAIGLPPIPTKAFRANGVHGWIVAFESKPTTVKFALQINGNTYEILLVEESAFPLAKPLQRQQNATKKNRISEVAGPSPKISQPSVHFVPTSSSAESQRIDRLEQRFEALESRQGRMEQKFDERFSDISSSLRQLLQAANAPRAREPTGESPAPKVPKHDA